MKFFISCCIILILTNCNHKFTKEDIIGKWYIIQVKSKKPNDKPPKIRDCMYFEINPDSTFISKHYIETEGLWSFKDNTLTFTTKDLKNKTSSVDLVKIENVSQSRLVWTFYTEGAEIKFFLNRKKPKHCK